LLLLTPVVLAAMRRLGTVATLVLVSLAATAAALASNAGAPLPSQFEELALYGAFWTFGAASPQIRARFSTCGPMRRAALAAAFAIAAAVWLVANPAPLGIVNASPMAELLLGAAWILGLAAAATWIVRLASRRRIRRAVDVLNRRAMTTYLWHCGAIALVHSALDAVGVQGAWRTPLLAALVALTTIALVTAAGPVEDLTAPRRRIPTLLPRALAGVAAVPCLLAAAILLPVGNLENAEGAYVPASGRGLDRLIADDGALPTIDDDEDWQQPVGPVTGGELDAVVAEWHGRWGMTGYVVAISRSDGVVWSNADGVDAGTGDDMRAGQPIDAHSITKSFTGALVAQLHAEQRIDLDETLAVWVPEFPHAGRFTLRQLAQHTSGLDDTGESIDAALARAGGEPLLFTPGEQTRYSDSAYYLLGLVAERATGQPYDQLVQQRFLDPLGLTSTSITTQRWSAGGVVSTARDLVTWAPQFWGGNLGSEVAAQATALDPANNFGVGTFGYCPCRGVGGLYRAQLYGHLSAQGRLAWDPVDDLAVMVHTNEVNDGDRTITAWTELDRLLRRQVAGRVLAS
jgi:CubicO group peptidase (beta-lactamase class C family)